MFLGRKRLMRKKNHEAIIDMNDFLVTYGAEKLGAEKPDLTQTIYNSGKNNLKGLDTLFKDQGFGRIHKYFDVARGFYENDYGLQGNDATNAANQMMVAAFEDLGRHAQEYNRWKQQ